MATGDEVWVEVSERGLTRDGVRYGEGRIVRVPEHALPGIVEASPPHGRQVSAEYAEAVRQGLPTDDIDPTAGPAQPVYQPDVDATASARELAETYELDLGELEGTGKDGRVLKEDVRDVLEARAG